MFNPRYTIPVWRGTRSSEYFIPNRVAPRIVDVPAYFSMAGYRYRHKGDFGADEEPEDVSATAQAPSALTALLPSVLEAVASGGDPRVQVELYEAKIKNMKAMKRKLPFLAWFYENEIRKLKAKKRAAEEKLVLKKESEASTRTWRNIGRAAAGVGIIAGIGVATLLFASASRVARK